MPTVSNWLTIRGAGVLFPLQATPLTATLNLVQAKKPSGSQISVHTHKLYPGWPSKSVVKIFMKPDSSQRAIVNDLYLETTSELETQLDQVVPGVSLAIDAGGDALMSGMFCACDWTGGDDKIYQSGSVSLNSYAGTDENGNDIWSILTRYYSRDAYGYWGWTSYDVVDNATAPSTTGAPCVLNGGNGSNYLSDPMNSAYATFSTALTAVDMLDDYTRTTPNPISLAVRFNPRHPDDSAHGTSSYVTGYDTSSNTGDILYVVGYDQHRFNGVFSYEPKATDPGANYNQRARTTCKWKYNSSACDDCWYAGKTVNIEVKYKKLGITKVVTPAPDATSNVSVELESSSWTDHSTVSYSLTLPSGTGTNQIGDTFEVPVSAGYIVAIDDIKLVSVA